MGIFIRIPLKLLLPVALVEDIANSQKTPWQADVPNDYRAATDQSTLYSFVIHHPTRENTPDYATVLEYDKIVVDVILNKPPLKISYNSVVIQTIQYV